MFATVLQLKMIDLYFAEGDSSTRTTLKLSQWRECFTIRLCSRNKVGFPSPGMTAIPCACLGIFLGGLLVKKLNLSALGAVRMAMLVNLVSTACYVSFLFLGCDTGPVAGVTVAYSNE